MLHRRISAVETNFLTENVVKKWLGGRLRAFLRLAWVSMVRAASLAPLMLSGGCSGSEAAAPAWRPRAGQLVEPAPIVLITIDTLRRDHVGAYGYHRETTPHIDRFAEDALVFEDAVATMATTLPSHLSILTGLYPRQHGFGANAAAVGGSFRSVPGAESVAVVLGRELDYWNAAFVSAAPVGSWTGIDAGFVEFDEGEQQSRKASETVDRACEWLAEQEQDSNFFLWVHLWDPHEPNWPEPEDAARFQVDDQLEALLDARGIKPEALEQAISKDSRKRFLQLESAAVASDSEGAVAQLPAVNREAMLSLLNRYDGDVYATDRAVGRLLSALQEHGFMQRAMVAITADHGQSLGQHLWLDHGLITNENVFVPLIVRFPDELGLQPGRVNGRVSLIDLMPTLLARLPGRNSLTPFLGQSPGQDLLTSDGFRGFAYCEQSSRERGRWRNLAEDGNTSALLTDQWKLLRRQGFGDALFDLEQDPGESRDVSKREPQIAEGLGQQLAETRALQRVGSLQNTERSKEEAARLLRDLEALGYVGDD